MKTDFFAIIWGLAIFLSMVGWGWAMIFALRLKNWPGLGVKAAFGLAFSAIFGGLMNLFGLISQTTIFAFLGLGGILLLAFIIFSFNRVRAGIIDFFRDIKKDKVFALLTVGIVLLFVFQYAVALFTPFNGGDDYQAYFVYPTKMLQTGSMGGDPFSDRRLTSSLGGESFLDTFVLAVLPHDYLHLIDRGSA